MRTQVSLPRLLSTAALIGALATVSACGSDDGDKGSDSSSTDGTTAPTGDDETDTASGGLIDVCTEITADEAGAIVGGTVTHEDVPGGGCNFAQDDPRKPSVSFTATAYDDANGGFEAAITGVSGVLQGDGGGPVDGVGEEAYVKTGTTGGENQQGGGLVRVGGTLVQVTYLQGDGQSADVVKEKVVAALTLAAGKI
ncbi:hypothetical protein ABIE44_000378 [Marmoricola sp. OAE513]|uniref:hypothetical protein n=1 Tax=Marmoricola sp. OAE513 TaxID=2817894 RepID=UPI001AE4EA3A